MSVVTDFTSSYNPVQVIRIPLSASVYDSRAILGLAEITGSALTELSNGLSDYVTLESLSTSIHTNELSTGVLSVAGSVFSVQQAGRQEVLNINDVRFYNLTDGNIVQSVLPRHIVDADVTVFSLEGQPRYFKLHVVVDNPDDPTLARVKPVEVDINELDPNNIEICNGVFLRIPGKKEWSAATFVHLKLAPDGTVTCDREYIHGEHNWLQLGRIADGILFTGNLIETAEQYPSANKLIMTIGRDGIWQTAPDPVYLYDITEGQLHALADEVGQKITTLSNNLDTLQDDVTNGFTSVDNVIGELSTNFDNRLIALNQRVGELQQELTDKINYLSGVCDEQWAQINNNKNALTAVVSKLSGIAQLSATDTFGTHMNVTNRVLSVLANLLV